MVEQRRYCIEIIQQLTAARRAIDQVSMKVMNGHIHSCVGESIRRQDGAKKIDELMQTIDRFVR